MTSTSLYPVSPKEELTRLYVGKSIRDVPTPAAVLDVAVAKRNCDRMLAALKALKLSWRAHVKTHKTVEVTKLQVGESSDPVKLIVSTLTEIDILLPTLQQYVQQGRPVNVLFGLPIAPGWIPRLAAAGKVLGKDSISVLLDYRDQIQHLSLFGDVIPHAHIKINMGGQRAGVVTGSDEMKAVIQGALKAQKEGHAILKGLYSHAGHSYGGDSRVAAVKMLRDELVALLEGAEEVATACRDLNLPAPSLTLSVGASPTALAVQNLLSGEGDEASGDRGDPAELKTAVTELASIFERIQQAGHVPEIHAGVYPTMDLQQLAAHSISTSLLSWRDIAFTVVAEVCSRYPGRGKDGTDEYIIGAGALALSREFCKAYPGLAMLTPWGRESSGVEWPTGEVDDHEGWMVGRFMQEHGILTWRETKGVAKPDELEVGQKVRLFPNHSCMTGSHFGWYFVVDSSREGKEDEIVDIYLRARGW